MTSRWCSRVRTLPETGPVDVLTDTLQRREQEFGRVHEASSSLMTAGEPFRLVRAAHDYPAFAGQQQAVSRYPGLESVTASSSAGYVDSPRSHPPGGGSLQRARRRRVDGVGDRAVHRPDGPEPHRHAAQPRDAGTARRPGVVPTRWAAGHVPAGDHRHGLGHAPVDAATGTATVTLPIGATRTLRFSVASISRVSRQRPGRHHGHRPAGSRHVADARRTRARGTQDDDAVRLRTTGPRVHLPGSGCATLGNVRAAEEAAALDRSFRVVGGGRWTWTSRPSPDPLSRPTSCWPRWPRLLDHGVVGPRR